MKLLDYLIDTVDKVAVAVLGMTMLRPGRDMGCTKVESNMLASPSAEKAKRNGVDLVRRRCVRGHTGRQGGGGGPEGSRPSRGGRGRGRRRRGGGGEEGGGEEEDDDDDEEEEEEEDDEDEVGYDYVGEVTEVHLSSSPVPRLWAPTSAPPPPPSPPCSSASTILWPGVTGCAECATSASRRPTSPEVWPPQRQGHRVLLFGRR